jgi:hypothetical protein
MYSLQQLFKVGGREAAHFVGEAWRDKLVCGRIACLAELEPDLSLTQPISFFTVPHCFSPLTLFITDEL